jgi:hypothetical protein
MCKVLEGLRSSFADFSPPLICSNQTTCYFKDTGRHVPPKPTGFASPETEGQVLRTVAECIVKPAICSSKGSAANMSYLTWGDPCLVSVLSLTYDAQAPIVRSHTQCIHKLRECRTAYNAFYPGLLSAEYLMIGVSTSISYSVRANTEYSVIDKIFQSDTSEASRRRSKGAERSPLLTQTERRTSKILMRYGLTEYVSNIGRTVQSTRTRYFVLCLRSASRSGSIMEQSSFFGRGRARNPHINGTGILRIL